VNLALLSTQAVILVNSTATARGSALTAVVHKSLACFSSSSGISGSGSGTVLFEKKNEHDSTAI